MSLPKFRWGFRTTVTNKLGMEISVEWFGVSWGPIFIGCIKDANARAALSQQETSNG